MRAALPVMTHEPQRLRPNEIDAAKHDCSV